ncbi:MAG: LGFP repeat-containing protein [Mycobacteriales bacterium]
MSGRLTDAASSVLAARFSRRGFLARSAIVGSALVTNPVNYLLRPVAAYSSICGPAAGCSDGFSVFCCTVNNGVNACPPGTIAGGWWKADRTSICGGQARYYIDCNAECSRCSSGCGHFCDTACWSCSCHCGPTSSCDQRRVCCNVFRYGQCHQEVACVGPVACRVVSCVPPYQLDPSCSTASATDDLTAAHSAPCNLNVWGAIAAHYYALGGARSPLGATTSDEYALPGGAGASFTSGKMYWSGATGAHYVRGAILSRYGALNGSSGLLGFPTSDELPAAGGGAFGYFQGGIIVWSGATGAHVVRGAILAKYLAMQGTASFLGFATSDELPAAGGGAFSDFQGGIIVWSDPTGAHVVRGAILAKYLAMQGTASFLGFATSDELPVGDGGALSRFQGGTVYWSAPTGARWVRGPILAEYAKLGGPVGRLGYPVTDRYAVTVGVENEFQHGWLTYVTAKGRVRVRYK